MLSFDANQAESWGGGGVIYIGNGPRNAFFDPPTGSIEPGNYVPDFTPNPEICAVIAANGFPEGCSQQSVAAGRPPIYVGEMPWQIESLMDESFQGRQIQARSGAALSRLANCYANAANLADACEAAYVDEIASIGNMYNNPGMYSEGVGVLSERAQGAATNRWQHGVLDSLGFSLGRFEINVLRFYNWAVGMDYWNQSLMALRSFGNCEKIVRAWNDNDCGVES